MEQEKRLELLRKARNLLHKQEKGKTLTNNEITFAHDYVDMVLDDMLYDEGELKLFRVAVSYGTCVIAAESKKQVLKVIFENETLRRDNSDLFGNIFPIEVIMNFIEEIPGYKVLGKPGIINLYQE